MLLLTLGGIFVKGFAHFGDFSFFFFFVLVVVFVLVLVFFLNNQTRDAIIGIVGLFEECMGELHASIFSSKVVIDVLTRVKNSTVFVFEDTDLDLGSTAGADGTAIVSSRAIILRVVNHFTIKEFSGLHVSVVFHIFDLVALVHAGVAVHLELTGEFLEFTFFVVLFFSVVVSLTVFFTSVAHFLLKFTFVLNDGLEVSQEVNHVFTVVVSTGTTRFGGAKAEDNETLGQENCVGIFFGLLVTVGLDELTLLELHGVLSNIGDVLLGIVKTTQLRVFCYLSTTHQFVHVLALGISRGGRCERV
mmetsp:Transcript_18517/g.25670  ORF Transcript_18517/g.25670 Transcript_18517/m.25670 type:complete len:303 (+) Transcript_18517:425-1333(+)